MLFDEELLSYSVKLLLRCKELKSNVKHTNICATIDKLQEARNKILIYVKL